MDDIVNYAEALVKCGYAERYRRGLQDDEIYFIGVMTGFDQVADPFANTLEGRRQLDALTNYIIDNDTAQIDRLALFLTEGHEVDFHVVQCEFVRHYFE